jgi:hypothetical protein
MIFCFRLQALVCLIPSLRPSSTELMPFLAEAISHIARNQEVSGSLVAWKIVPAVSETWWRQARHRIFGRVRSHLPSQPPQAGQTNPPGQRSFSTTARHRSSVPYASRNCASLSPRTRDASLPGIPCPHHGQAVEELSSDLLPFQATQVRFSVFRR